MNEKLSGKPGEQQNPNLLSWSRNMEEYKRVFKGQKPNEWKSKLWSTEVAYEIRDKLIKLALLITSKGDRANLTHIGQLINETEEVKNLNKRAQEGLEIKITQSLLSSAALGVAGKDPNPKYHGLSTTEFISQGLTKVLEEMEGQQQIKNIL